MMRLELSRRQRTLGWSISQSLQLNSPQEFLRRQFVGRCASTVFVVVNNRLAEARGFGQPRRPRNDRFKNPLAEMLPDFAHDLIVEFGPPIEHGHEYPQHLKPLINACLA